MTATEIDARMTEIDRAQAAIERDARDDNGGAFTPRQRVEYDTLDQEFRELTRKFRAMSLAANPRRLPPTSGGPLGESSDVRRGDSQPRGVLSDQSARNLGTWALAALSKCMPGRFDFPDAVRFANDRWGPTATMTTSDATTGSHFTVPEEFGGDLVRLIEEYGVIRRLFRRVPMTSDRRNDPRRVGGLTAHFVNEGEAGSASDMTFSNVALTAKDLMTLTAITAQLSADSALDIGNTLADEISRAFGEKEDQCGFNGDGTLTYGGMQGVRLALQLAAGSPTTTSAGGVIVGTGNAYSELVLADFENVVSILPQYADNGAVWVASRKFYFGVMLPLSLDALGATARDIREGAGSGRPLFLGYPVEISQVMPTAAANSQLCVLLGNFNLGASFGDRQETRVMFSEHATVGGQSMFERNMIAVRGTERFDINCSYGVGDATTAGPIVGLQTLNS